MANAIKSILPKHEDLNITREQMTLLVMESYKKSANSAEELMCLREVAKMNGLYEKSPTTQINVLNIEQNIKKLETLSDDELLQLAGHDPKLFKQMPALANEPDIEDADYSEVED